MRLSEGHGCERVWANSERLGDAVCYVYSGWEGWREGAADGRVWQLFLWGPA